MEMDRSQLAMVETYADHLYTPRNAQEHAEANRMLAPFMTDASYLPHCRFVLEHTQSPYATTFAALCIDRLVTKHFPVYDLSVKVDLRNYLLQYLYSHLDLPQYTVLNLVTALCRITRLGWLDSEELTTLVDRATAMLQVSPQHCALSLQILSQLTVEINMQPATRVGSRYRRASSQFRDRQLQGVFQVGLNILRSLISQGDVSHSRLLENCMQLIKNCLSYDFIGTMIDESVDDAGTVQLPTSWRSMFDDGSVIAMFFEAYARLPPMFSSQAMECLVLVASFRRALFNSDAERIRFLSSLLNGSYQVLNTGAGLDNQSNFHETCRFLSRLKHTFQLAEFVSCDVFNDWMNVAYAFTLKALRLWQWAPNSVQYILSFWNRMVQSVQYNAKLAAGGRLSEMSLEVAKAYVSSRLDSVQEILQNSSIDNPLDDDESLLGELEIIGGISRALYPDMSPFLVSVIDPLARQYQDLFNTWTGSAVHVKQRRLIEEQCAWFAFILSRLIGARVHMQTTDETELMDGDLSARMLQLTSISDMWLSSGRGKGTRHLQVSVIAFLHNLRKNYVGEQTQRASKIYNRLGEQLGINDQSMLLDLIARKLISCLKFWDEDEQILTRTLEELLALTTGFSSARLLCKLDVSRYLLKSFSSSVFPFLDHPSNGKNRVSFAHMITRLLFAEESADAQFEEFIAPLSARLDQLLAIQTREGLAQASVQVSLVGAFQDLRGVCAGCATKKQYGAFFDWFYPTYAPLVRNALEANCANPLVTTPLLRFVAELAHSKNHRCQFESSSANGILLFREISAVLASYGNFIASANVPQDRKYPLKYKGIAICFTILKRALSGAYVNFGVFKLYQDAALDNALDVFFRLMLSVPLSDMMALPKLHLAYAETIEFFMMDHLATYTNLSFDMLFYMTACFAEGIRVSEQKLSSMHCNNLDLLCGFIVRQVNSAKPVPMHPAVRFVKERPDTLQYNMVVLLQMLCMEDSVLYWSLSRPLLSLILLDEKFFGDYTSTLLKLQPADRRKDVSEAFTALMQDVDRTITAKNRDRFAQNITVFRRHMSNVTQSMPLMPSPFESLLS